jgi:hypothetical protein
MKKNNKKKKKKPDSVCADEVGQLDNCFLQYRIGKEDKEGKGMSTNKINSKHQTHLKMK